MPGAIAEGWGEGGSFLMHALHTNKATPPFPLVNGASFTKDGMGVGRSPRMHYTQTKPHSPSPALIPIPSPRGRRERGRSRPSMAFATLVHPARRRRAGARPVHFGKDGMGVGRSACGAASA